MCNNPSHIYINKGHVPVKQAVACHQCWSCKANRLNDWVGRCLAEAAVSKATVTLTLTYAPRDDLAERVLTPSHFQQFMRKLRRRGHKVRYLVAGEYGELKGRAHFHAILFFETEPPQMPEKRLFSLDEWPHGHVYADTGTDERAIRYVCKYLLKGAAKQAWISQSKKPALGAKWFAMKAQEAVELGVLPRTFTYHAPGGSKKTPYLMTGATRRDYVNAVVEGWLEKRPLDRARVSDWMLNALERRDKAEHLSRIAQADIEEQMAVMAEELEARRPNSWSVLHQMLDGEPVTPLHSEY